MAEADVFAFLNEHMRK